MGNRLSKISTKTGDDGTTGLSNGSRLSKNHPRIDAIGTIDELNSFLGLLATHPIPDDLDKQLLEIQNHLFNLGGGLSMPSSTQLMTLEDIQFLDDSITRFNAELPPLKEFVLPGGDSATATCHVARSICRRAERCVAALLEQESNFKIYLQYLNRLSDLLFVMARYIGRANETEERLWRGIAKPE